MQSDSLLTAEQVAAALGLHVHSFWRWVSAERFPGPDLTMGRKYRRWYSSTLATWCAAHTTAQKGGGAHE